MQTKFQPSTPTGSGPKGPEQVGGVGRAAGGSLKLFQQTGGLPAVTLRVVGGWLCFAWQPQVACVWRGVRPFVSKEHRASTPLSNIYI